MASEDAGPAHADNAAELKAPGRRLQLARLRATFAVRSGSEFFLIYSLRPDVIDGTKRRFEFEVTKEIADVQAAGLNNTAAFSALA
jgi:hypothetical protein